MDTDDVNSCLSVSIRGSLMGNSLIYKPISKSVVMEMIWNRSTIMGISHFSGGVFILIFSSFKGRFFYILKLILPVHNKRYMFT